MYGGRRMGVLGNPHKHLPQVTRWRYARWFLGEKAHAKGGQHGEGTPETNAAYYPSVEITGR
jgi:hypothetical protein